MESPLSLTIPPAGMKMLLPLIRLVNNLPYTPFREVHVLSQLFNNSFISSFVGIRQPSPQMTVAASSSASSVVRPSELEYFVKTLPL